MGLIHLYSATSTSFDDNGTPLVTAREAVVKRDEGFQLTFSIPISQNELHKRVQKEMIVSAMTPDGVNYFRIWDIEKRTTDVKVTALQLLYSLDVKQVNPFGGKKYTGTTILQAFVNSFKSSISPYTFSSSILTSKDFYTNEKDDTSTSHNALAILNKITDSWSGELMLNGFDVRMISKLGTKTDALLYEHKNIASFSDSSSMNGIVTRIYATATYTPERAEGATEDPEPVVLSATVDSPLINQYAVVYEATMEYNDARTVDELRKEVLKQYSEFNVDKPERTIDVDTNIVDGTAINFGDELVLKYLVHDVDEVIRCVGYEYDPISENYIGVTLGTLEKTFLTKVTEGLSSSVDKRIDKINKQIQVVQASANGKNRVTYGPNPVPNAIEGDLWFKHPEGRPDEVELLIYQNGQWLPAPFLTDQDKLAIEQEMTDLYNEAKAAAEAQDKLISDRIASEVSAIGDAMRQAKQEAIDASNKALTDAKAHAEAEDTRIRGELESDIGGAINLAEQAKQDAIDKANQVLVDAKAHAEAKDVLLKQAIGLEIDGVIEIAEQAKSDATTKAQTAYDEAVAEADRLAGLRDDGITIAAGQITAGVIDAARLNASEIVTSGLTANVIKSTHIQTSTLLVDKIFANQAMVDQLWSKAIWTTKLTALKIDASQINAGTIATARLNASDIVTNGLTANVISATHINGDTALFDKLFSTTLATTRLVAQGAWITDANIVSLNASKIKAGTIDTARLNASDIVTKGLTTDVVTATHIKSENALIDTIFANQALVDRLWAKTIWTTKINAMSLDAARITSGTIATARLNASAIVTAGLTTDVVKATHIKGDTALIDTIFASQALIEKLTSKTAFINSIKAISIDVSKITGNTANFISAGFKSLNSQATINGHAIRIQNSSGEFVEMNNTPELRSDDAGGTAVVLGKGRVQFYDSRGHAKGYVGTDMYTAGNYDFGTYLSKGTGIYRFARMADATQTTYAYYTVKAGKTAPSSVITDMVINGYLPDGNPQQFVAKGNMLSQLNGWPAYPNWPTLTAGQKIRYKELTTQTTGDAYETIWKFGPSSQGDWRIYFSKHATFEGGTTGTSDRRLKHSIEPTQIEALHHIESLTFKEFRWNRDNKYEPLGLIAQDSGIIRVSDDTMEGIDIQRAIMLALKGTQELQEIVKEQAEEIKQLKEITNQ